VFDIMRNLRRRLGDERGAGLVEYTLLVALIALVCIGALAFFGTRQGEGVNKSARCLQSAHDGTPLDADCR